MTAPVYLPPAVTTCDGVLTSIHISVRTVNCHDYATVNGLRHWNWGAVDSAVLSRTLFLLALNTGDRYDVRFFYIITVLKTAHFHAVSLFELDK